MEKMLKILQRCQPDGSWKMDKINLKNIGLSQLKATSDIPTSVMVLGQSYQSVWMTVLTLYHLERNFINHRHIWGLHVD